MLMVAIRIDSSRQAHHQPVAGADLQQRAEDDDRRRCALVTAISGVCSEWLTFQITWKPTKQASAKTMKWDMKLAGA